MKALILESDETIRDLFRCQLNHGGVKDTEVVELSTVPMLLWLIKQTKPKVLVMGHKFDEVPGRPDGFDLINQISDPKPIIISDSTYASIPRTGTAEKYWELGIPYITKPQVVEMLVWLQQA